VKYADLAKPSRYVEVVSLADGGNCRIDVRDNGIGIPDHALNAIFRRFTRAHADRDELAHISGVGLGLAIADDCVRAMGGRIAVTSVEGAGTTFTLTLPLTPPTNGDHGV
jgi:two-component system OmpR family sensor kinase